MKPSRIIYTPKASKKNFERELFWVIELNGKKKKGTMSMRDWNKRVNKLYEIYSHNIHS